MNNKSDVKSTGKVTFYTGVLLVIIGMVTNRFLIIRPNRIVNGRVIKMQVALDGYLIPFFALLCFMLIITYIYLKTQKVNPLTLISMGIIVLGVFLLITGQGATKSLLDMGTSARASLGYSFWLMFAGLILIIIEQINFYIHRSNEKKNSRIPYYLIKPMVLLLCLILFFVFYFLGLLSDISIIRELSDKKDRIFGELLRHMQLSLSATGTGLLISLILSYQAYKNPTAERFVNMVANFAQVVPTLSLLGLIMIPLALLANRFGFLRELGISGIGFFPAYIVLTLYTLLPLTTNTIAGFRSIPPSILEAALGMGMTPKQILYKIEIPMAFPAIYSGTKTALIQTVGNCILAGLVGGGGLGAILFLGLAQSAADLVVVAALMVVLIAVVLNVLLTGIEVILIRRLRGELVHD